MLVQQLSNSCSRAIKIRVNLFCFEIFPKRLTGWKPVISIDLSPSASLLATGSGDWAARICTCHFYVYSHFPMNWIRELQHRMISFHRACTSLHNNASALILRPALTRYIGLFLLPLPAISFGHNCLSLKGGEMGAPNVYNLSAISTMSI